VAALYTRTLFIERKFCERAREAYNGRHVAAEVCDHLGWLREAKATDDQGKSPFVESWINGIYKEPSRVSKEFRSMGDGSSESS
jgi:hypothetical protein